MGLIYSRFKLLLEAKELGADFTSTITIGRQKLSLSKKENFKLLSRFALDNEIINYDFNKRNYADQLLKNYLNIKELIALDISNYEDSAIITDLNYPVSKKLYNKYDTLVDGGTIEHIFNFPQAIKNYMDMVKINGNIFIFTNANNHCGHGFYQFSPELFYRIFNINNGFEIKSLILMEHPFPGAELSTKQICYQTKDPSEIGKRINLVTDSPVGIMIHAKKLENVKIFSEFPIQSDYDIDNKNPKSNKKSLLKYNFDKLPKFIRRYIIGVMQLRNSSLKNKNHFSRLK